MIDQSFICKPLCLLCAGCCSVLVYLRFCLFAIVVWLTSIVGGMCFLLLSSVCFVSLGVVFRIVGVHCFVVSCYTHGKLQYTKDKHTNNNNTNHIVQVPPFFKRIRDRQSSLFATRSDRYVLVVVLCSFSSCCFFVCLSSLFV